jgi:hypothetical protein
LPIWKIASTPLAATTFLPLLLPAKARILPAFFLPGFHGSKQQAGSRAPSSHAVELGFFSHGVLPSSPSSSSKQRPSSLPCCPWRAANIHHGARRLSPSSVAAAGSCLLQRAGTAGPPSSPSPSPWHDASAPCPPLHGRELHFPWMAPRKFSSSSHGALLPQEPGAAAPIFLAAPCSFSSSRLPFFTWPNTAPCPWMQQQLALARRLCSASSLRAPIPLLVLPYAAAAVPSLQRPSPFFPSAPCAASSCAHSTSPCLLSVPSDQQQGQPPSLAPFGCARGVRHNACEEGMLSQHHRRSSGICCFCAAPNIVVVHPGETATLLVRFRRQYFPMINYVCVLLCFVLWRRETPCFA